MTPVPKNPKGRPQLEQLRRQIKEKERSGLQGGAGSALSGWRSVSRGGAVPSDGAASNDQTSKHSSPDSALALAPGLHEVCPASYLDTPAALAFQTGLIAAQLARDGRPRLVVWVRQTGGRDQDFGLPCPQALTRWGLPPERMLLVEADEARDVLWVMEEGLRAGSLVVGEIGRNARYDLTASKRLHRMARAQNIIVLALRHHGPVQPSAALTRWRISAQPSPAQPWRGANGLPGLGPPRFRAMLERVRSGPPKDFEIEWKNAAFHVLEPASLADRAAQQTPRQQQAVGRQVGQQTGQQIGQQIGQAFGR
jgi:hypothetical protein